MVTLTVSSTAKRRCFSGLILMRKLIDQTEGSIIYRKGEKQIRKCRAENKYVYDHTTLLPRMYSTENKDGSYAQDAQFYRQWLHMGDNDAPTFADNLKWMFSWQM